MRGVAHQRGHVRSSYTCSAEVEAFWEMSASTLPRWEAGRAMLQDVIARGVALSPGDL